MRALVRCVFFGNAVKKNRKLKKRLGLDQMFGGDAMDAMIDDEDLVLAVPKADELAQTDINELVDFKGLSARERNRLKRKARGVLKR
jgi:hypothetical protein